MKIINSAFKKYIMIILLASVISCKEKKIDKLNGDFEEKITFNDEYKICDTCTTTILVHHNESTTSGEITIDSGIVYLSHEILKNVNSLAVNIEPSKKPIISPNHILNRELHFADKNYFNKLWKDTINFTDLYKAFRLKGKVTEIKRRKLENGVIESYPSLFFKVEKAVEIDTTYLKTVSQY
jgi:hypothetical protein